MNDNKICKCDMRTKLVGDGCEICNPAKALEYAKDTIEFLIQERDELRSALMAILESPGGGPFRRIAIQALNGKGGDQDEQMPIP